MILCSSFMLIYYKTVLLSQFPGNSPSYQLLLTMHLFSITSTLSPNNTDSLLHIKPSLTDITPSHNHDQVKFLVVGFCLSPIPSLPIDHNVFVRQAKCLISPL